MCRGNATGMDDPEDFSSEKQRQILRGAATIFAREGYEGASMSQIASEAGVSKGTLYNYFTSKADLFSTYIADECSQRIACVFGDGIKEDELETAMRDIAHRILKLLLSEHGLTTHRIVISEALKFPELARTFHEAGPARAVRIMADWLDRQRQRGQLRLEDPYFAAEQFFALLNTRVVPLRRLQLLSADSAAAEVDRVVDASVAMFLRFYGTENTGR